LDVKLASFDSPVSESPQTRGILKKYYVLVKMFPQFGKMMIRLQMNMRRFKGSQFGSVIKALIFPTLPVPLLLLRLILSLVKLIVFGTWEVVSVFLNLITLGVIVPPPKVCCVF
jgi:hypothetical protein